MKLENWIRKNHVRRAEFASRIGVTPMQISRYCRGESVPREHVMRRIMEVTNGAVQPNDFYRLDEQKEAAE